MAKAKKIEVHETQGHLFPQMRRDYNPFWMSSLFSDVYLKNDVPRVYKNLWENDEIENSESGFAKFYQGFVDLAIHHENSKFESWNEAQTVKDWIVPIMDLLGWENNSVKGTNSYLDNETFNIENQTYKPDLIYFDKPKYKDFTQKHKKDVTLKLNEIRNSDTGAKMVVEAKHWNRLTSNRNEGKKDAKLTDSAVSLGPELQTLKYMEVLGLDFGILTDGKIWKLFHKDLSKSVDKRSFTFDLGKLKEIAQDLYSHGQEELFRENAKYFYYFFSKSSFYQVDDSKVVPIVREVFEHSKKYAHEIEEDLKKRFIITMGLTCNALKNSCKRQKEEVDLETIRNVAESHLFNILFVKSCEVRQILPIKSPNYLKVSLHEVIEYLDYMHFDPEKELDTFFKYFQTGVAFGGKEFTYDGFQIFERFINLYEIIHDGTAKSKDFGFEIEGFKESIFNKEEWRFASRHKITNGEMIKILFTLNFTKSIGVPGRSYQQIPYSYFTPRQLGSIYESFLDHKLEKAETGMIFQKGKWQKANTSSSQVKNLSIVDNHIVEKSDLFFSTDNDDRENSGSFYTPDYIVKSLIENTLSPLVKDRTSVEILELKLCDPSMGSGHFLAGAMDYLVNVFRKKWCEENNDDIEESIEESSRRILDSCLYGVDLNPRAVKLAKMSMWLMTAYSGKKLEKLDDQFKCGDSLDKDKFRWSNEFKFLKDKKGFDAIVGNPPYVKISKIKETNSYEENFTTFARSGDLYILFIEKSLQLINDCGRVGIITPNKFFLVDYGAKIRKLLSQGSSVEKIVDFEHYQVFEDAMTYTCLLYLTKTSNENLLYCTLKDFNLKNKFDKKNLNLKEIELKKSNDIWNFDSGKRLELTGILMLSDIMETMFQGLATTCDPVYMLKVKNGKLYSKHLNSEVSIEKELLKPMYRGKELGKFNLPINTEVVIFPYKIRGSGDYVPIEIEEFKLKYPKAYEYLRKCKSKLDLRENGKMLNKKNWHLYSQEHNLGYFESVKIITKVMSKDGSFCIDETGKSYFVGGGTAGGYGLVLKKEFVKKIDLIVAILNSNTIFRITQKNNSVFNGGYYSYSKKTLSNIPLRLNNIDEKLESKIIKVVLEIREKGYTVERQKKVDDLIVELYSEENLIAA